MGRYVNKPKVLVICVDRDDDLGRKTGIKGPVIGRDANIDAVLKFGIRDPSDSDVNALFKAIQVYDNLVRKKENVEIVTLTGDINVGLISDRKIRKQLGVVLKNMGDRIIDEAILVSDGDEDTHIMPILKDNIQQVYVEKIVVKQSSALEGMYYMIQDFINYVMTDTRASKLFLGLPSIALILYAVFGAAGGRLILGTIGIYLLIKGFHLDPFVNETSKEIKESIEQSKFSIFLYIVGASFIILGIFSGYKSTALVADTENMIIYASTFIQNSVVLFAVSAVSVGIGKMIRHGKNIGIHVLTYLVLCFVTTWIVLNVTDYILVPSIGYLPLIYSIIISAGLLILSNIVERVAGRKKRL